MSPKIYYYFEVTLEFWSNEYPNEGPHVHVISKDRLRGVKALIDAATNQITWIKDKKRQPLTEPEQWLAEEIVPEYKSTIVKKFMDFKDGKKVKPIRITRRIK